MQCAMNLLALEVEGIGTSHHAQDKTTLLVPYQNLQKATGITRDRQFTNH